MELDFKPLEIVNTEINKLVEATIALAPNVFAALVLLLMLELNHLTPWLLHVFGLLLLGSRIAHAWGLSRRMGPSPGRFYGTALGWLTMAAMAVVNILIVVSR